ncbi:MAG: hypothetical protein AB7S26_32060 [Sandaracinaceae bacterium]
MTRASLALIVALALPVPAAAQLEGAARLEAEGDLLGAARAYHAAVAEGGLRAADAARAHARLGVLDRATGDTDEAWAHFAIALAIDPSQAAPDELPPDEHERFDRLRGTPYAIAARVDGDVITVEVSGAPAIARAVRAGDATIELDAGRATFPRPASDVLELTAIDEHRNDLCTIQIELPAPTDAVDLRVEADDPRGCADGPCVDPAPCALGGPGCEDEGGPDPLPILGGVIGAVCGVAAVILTIALSVDAYEGARWRVEGVELP